MSLTSPNLKNFIEPVPPCIETAPLKTLRSIFSLGNCDRVAVVNQQLKPLGLVYLRSLAPMSPQARDWEQPLTELYSQILAPLRSVSAELSAIEFWEYLQTTALQDPAIPIALTNASGQFLGLLDSLRLLQFAAANCSLASRATAPHPSVLTRQTDAAGVAYPPEPTAPATELDTQVRFLEAGLQPSEGLNSLVQLLEKLPLPLRLQTLSGQIVCHNAAWRMFLGGGPQPIAETTAISDQTSNQSESKGAAYQRVQIAASTKECRTLVGAARVAESKSTANSCPLPLYSASPSSLIAPVWCPIVGGKSNTKFCDCPMHQDRERIWQFVKQPLSQNLILIVGQDVTEEHLVAKELAAKNADLIQLNRLKDEFLSCISHELKTPLTAVLGLSSLLKDKLIGELNERQTRYAKLIHQSGRHLMTVVNDILDLTRMETGQLELIPETVEIASTCQKAFEQAKQRPQQEVSSTSKQHKTNNSAGGEPDAKIEFSLEIEPGLETLIADELRLRQMLFNLLSNAIKFTENGGKIGLKVTVWQGWIAFTVWDTGIGIPADKQHLIFQKFQQLESPLTRRFQGTGLGLVLTQRLARLHGGDVSFISSEGQGSQFTLLLPPHPPEKNREKSEDPAETAGELLKVKSQQPIAIGPARSRLILIVEAVPQYIENLTTGLCGLGYQVIVARSGTEALEKARRFSPEAIFLNPLLPLLSGWDLLTLLKSDPDTRSIPAIVTATRGEKERASVNRADGFLTVPVKTPALRRLLEDSIGLLQDPPPDSITNSLTVLWLSPQNSSSEGSSLLLDPNYCRVLEADDLGQAELVARIWRPDAIVLDGTSQLQDPCAFMEQLSMSRSLGTLPLITLDPATTQLANQVPGLSVFPCLAAGSARSAGTNSARSGASALWQVIQVAAGMNWKPCILFADMESLQDLQPIAAGNLPQAEASMENAENADLAANDLEFHTRSKLASSNFQALIQYIQTAGFRASIARSRTEVLQQLQYQSADLLLLCLRDAPTISPAMLQSLSYLRKIATKLPILVCDYRSSSSSQSEGIDFLLQEISATILPSSLSAAQLLYRIQQLIKR